MSGAGRAKHRELVGDREGARAEPVELGRPPARAPRWAPVPSGLENAAAQKHALQVGCGDLVAERSGVEVAQLGHAELSGREREAEVGVRELGAEPFAARERD